MNKKTILSVLAGSVLLSGITNAAYADLTQMTGTAGIQEQMRVVRIAEADLRRRLAPIAAARQRERLRDRRAALVAETQTRKAAHLTLVTPYGVARNAYWNNIQSEVVADDLFAQAAARHATQRPSWPTV